MSDQVRKRRPYAARVPMAERRTQLLDAALQIIGRDGYDGVSIDAIAREAGVTRPVVYGAFDGLGPLLMALLERQQQRALMQLFRAIPQEPEDGNPVELVRQAGPVLHQMLLDDPVTWHAILQSATNAPEVVRERVESDREQVRIVVERLVAGALGKRTDAEVLSHAVLAVLERFGQLVLADPERFTASRLTDAVTAVLGLVPGRVA